MDYRLRIGELQPTDQVWSRHGSVETQLRPRVTRGLWQLPTTPADFIRVEGDLGAPELQTFPI